MTAATNSKLKVGVFLFCHTCILREIPPPPHTHTPYPHTERDVDTYTYAVRDYSHTHTEKFWLVTKSLENELHEWKYMKKTNDYFFYYCKNLIFFWQSEDFDGKHTNPQSSLQETNTHKRKRGEDEEEGEGEEEEEGVEGEVEAAFIGADYCKLNLFVLLCVCVRACITISLLTSWYWQGVGSVGKCTHTSALNTHNNTCEIMREKHNDNNKSGLEHTTLLYQK